MAERVHTSLIDDLDPSGETIADERIRFTWEGEEREIDLCMQNAQGFREAMDRYVKASRLVRKQKLVRTEARRLNSKTCRRWLREVRNYEVPERGRIPAGYATEYQEAGSPTSW